MVSGFVRTWVAPFVIVAFFFLTAASLEIQGRSSRHILSNHTVYRIDKLNTAFFLWHDLHLHGRIILYFDKYFSIDETFIESINLRFSAMEHHLPEADSRNFLLLAIYNDIFREVYHIVPDDAWPGVRDRLSGYPFIAIDGRQFRLTVEGCPVIVTRLQDVPSLSEKAVIFLNEAYRGDYDEQMLTTFLQDARKADVVVLATAGGGAN